MNQAGWAGGCCQSQGPSPSHGSQKDWAQAAATFQKDATGPWRRVVFKAESALLQHSGDQPFFQTSFPVACHESVDGGPRGPGSLGPMGAASLRVLAALGPSASPPQRTLLAEGRGGLGAHCDSGPACGSYPTLCGSPCTPFWMRAWLPVTLMQRPPRHVFGAPSLHHPRQVGSNLSPSWESLEGK